MVKGWQNENQKWKYQNENKRLEVGNETKSKLKTTKNNK